MAIVFQDRKLKGELASLSEWALTEVLLEADRMMGRTVKAEDWESLLFQAFRKTVKLIREKCLFSGEAYEGEY